MTPEKRLETIPEQLRLRLLHAATNDKRARREVEHARDELVTAISEALDEGASYRNVASLIDLPHQTVQNMVKTAKR
jgi:hypothetical protein